MTRPSTPNQVDGTQVTLTVKRTCNGCGRELGDANDVELLAAIAGDDLPDVRVECGCVPAPMEPPC